MDFLPKVGQKVELQIPLGPHEGTYSTYVDDVNAAEIAMVIPQIEGTPIRLLPGYSVHLAYVQPNARISFVTRVSLVEDKTIPIVKVLIPEQTQVVRKQLRSFVRQEINLNLLFRVKMIPGSEAPLANSWQKSSTKEISGSGAQILCTEEYPVGTVLDLRLELDGTVLEVTSEVIRSIQQVHSRQWWMALRFLDIGERDRDMIVRYIFNVQRTLRQKGLLGR